jgi:hypothetical protein
MSKKPETLFRARLRAKLDEIPNSFFESIQQVGINGTPDIIGCVGPFFVAIEVKAEDGETSSLQKYKLDRIAKCGAIALIVKPSTLKECLKKLKALNNRI